MKIFYLVPSNDKPSWGMGIIYHHVNILCRSGFDCSIIKEKNLFVPGWLNLKVSVKDYDYLKKEIRQDDFLVVPESMLDFPGLKKIKCRKIVFIQNTGFLFESMPKGEDHISLGFQHIFIHMPHMISIIENHVKLPYTIIPPFVAEYFFTNGLQQKRQRQILIYPKFHQIDYSVLKYLTERRVNDVNKHWTKDIFKQENWKVNELKNLSHEETAEEMKKSIFFISLNVFESLNASVTEAMAAGCIVFCYEGFGPRDFLDDRVNAFSFKNNEVYELVETLFNQIDNYTKNEDALKLMRQNAFETAKGYSQAKTEKALLSFFANSSNA